MTDDDHDRLVRLAFEAVERVREVGPAWNWVWWQSLTQQERDGVAWVLACMVDPDASMSQLLGWTWPFARDVAS